MSTDNTGATGQPPTGDDALKALQAQLNDAVKERDDAKGRLRELGKTDETLKTLRGELSTLMADKSKLQEEYEGFKQTVKKKEIDTNLATALAAAGAHNPETVKRLLDLEKIKFDETGSVDPKSISEMIAEVQKTDSYLFKEAPKEDAGKSVPSSTPTTGPTLPNVKPAAQGEQADAFKAALEVAKKAKDPFKAIEEVMTQFKKQ